MERGRPQTYRVGVIGTGFASSSHIEALRRLPHVEVAAIAGSSDDKARSAAEREGIAAAFGDYRALVADDSIDAIHNCTPNYVHAEINERALAAGKHVLSEKPLATNSRETAELMRQAAAADVVSGVCFNYRHYPLVRQVKAMLESGEYGRLHFVHGSYLQDWLLYRSDWNWRLDTAKSGESRAIADIGSHWLDLVQYLVSERVVEVCADLATLHPQRLRPPEGVATFEASDARHGDPFSVTTEDFGTVMVRFEGGARGAFQVSQVSAGHKNRLFVELDTAEASFAWDQEAPNELWIGRRAEANRELVRDPSLLHSEAAKLAHFPGGHQEGWPDGLKNLFLDFYVAVDAAKRGESYDASFATFADAHRLMLIVEAILASSRSGGWEKISAHEEVAL